MSTDRPVIREIITKAVCGSNTYKYRRSIDLEIPPEQKNIQVLGNFVSNASIEETLVVDHTRYEKAVQVKGRYDVHVWYAVEQETCAAKTTVTFNEYIPIQISRGESISDLEAFAKITQKPKCQKAYVKHFGNKTVIRVEIEQEISAQVVGVTKLKVGIHPSPDLGIDPVRGQELIPPSQKQEVSHSTYSENFYDFKCEDEIPDYDDDDLDDYNEHFDN